MPSYGSLNGVVKSVDKLGKLMENVAKLQANDVLIGIPAAKVTRRQDAASNATLAYIHENGSPAKNIPARPFLHPSIKKHKSQLALMFRQLADDVLKKGADPIRGLNRIGMFARNNAVAEITNPSPPFAPLSHATIRGRLRKTAAGRRKLQKFKNMNKVVGGGTKQLNIQLGLWASDNLRPLIDTGQLRAAITYVVREGKVKPIRKFSARYGGGP